MKFMNNPQWHNVALPDRSFHAVIDLAKHHNLIKAIARANGVRYSTKTKCATKATEHLLPIITPIDGELSDCPYCGRDHVCNS